MATVRTDQLIDECRKRFVEASRKARGRQDRDRALYQAIATACRIASRVERNRTARAVLEKSCRDHGIPKPKEGSNKFLQIVKVCVPDRQTRDYSNYANAVKFFRDRNHSSQKVLELLDQKSLSHFAGLGRRRRAKAGDGPKAGMRSISKRARAQLRKQKLLGSFRVSSETVHATKNGWVVLIARRANAESSQINVYASVDCDPKTMNSLFVRYGRREGLDSW